MSKEIKISKKHGLNPALTSCFFCGKTKNEIALFGQLPDDAEAPIGAVINYEPCDTCKAKMEQGITLIAVSEKPVNKNQPPITKGAYPTGPFVTIKEDAIGRIFKPEVAKNIIKAKTACVAEEIVMKIIELAKE